MSRHPDLLYLKGSINDLEATFADTYTKFEREVWQLRDQQNAKINKLQEQLNVLTERVESLENANHP